MVGLILVIPITTPGSLRPMYKKCKHGRLNTTQLSLLPHKLAISKSQHWTLTPLDDLSSLPATLSTLKATHQRRIFEQSNHQVCRSVNCFRAATKLSSAITWRRTRTSN